MSGSIPFFYIDEIILQPLGPIPFYRKTEAGLQPLDLDYSFEIKMVVLSLVVIFKDLLAKSNSNLL